MATLRSDVYTAAGDGRVMRFNDEFDCTASFRAHQGVVLSSTIVQATHSYPGGEDDKGVRWELITAGDDSYVKVSTSFPSLTSQPRKQHPFLPDLCSLPMSIHQTCESHF